MRDQSIVRYEFAFSFPTHVEPAWSARVERWYQLDAFAYGLAEFYESHAVALGPHPRLIVLASAGASNETDYAFALEGALSPAKFVHTLPNIRLSALCQVMAWAGPVLCVQRDPDTFAVAVEEARWLVTEFEPIWVLGVKSAANRDSIPTDFRVECAVLGGA